MSETNTLDINGEYYQEYPMQAGLTVGDLIEFLEQFPERDQEIAWYLISEDLTPYVGLHPDEHYGDDSGDPPTPMIVTSFVPYSEAL